MNPAMANHFSSMIFNHLKVYGRLHFPSEEKQDLCHEEYCSAGAIWEPLNKSSLERVDGKIGMIVRRTTKAVAGSAILRSATP